MTRPRNPTRTAIATVRQLFDLIDTTGLSYREVARRMGLSHVTLSQWKNGDKAPNLQNIENALQTIGYRLDIAPMEPSMTEFHRRLEANIRESLRFAVGEVDEEAVAHMLAGVKVVLNHPCAPAP